MKTNLMIEKAAQQMLSEVLGYDEAKAYYLLLSNKSSELETEYSYSKRYRLLKSLFEQGAAGKMKKEDQDFFSYFLLPPSFLYKEKADIELIEYLEKLYLENFGILFRSNYLQVILRDDKALFIFLLKYFMKDEARIFMGDFDLKKILGKHEKKVEIVNDNLRRGIIDKNLSLEFVGVPGLEKNKEFIGYMSRS